jgi:hypothetical protein
MGPYGAVTRQRNGGTGNRTDKGGGKEGSGAGEGGLIGPGEQVSGGATIMRKIP